MGAGLLWARVLPLNKNLWTGSYVLFTSGAAAAGLALCLLLVDVRGRAGLLSFFLPFGRNPLLAFVGSGFLAKTMGLLKIQRWLFTHGFAWIPDPVVASHAYAVAFILFWWAILAACDRRGLYWKV